MKRIGSLPVGTILVLGFIHEASACASVSRRGAVVNADQTVVILWSEEKKQQHFIRKASFKAEVKDVGFIVPSPSRPELEESGGAAFSTLFSLTKPEVGMQLSLPIPIGCGRKKSASAAGVQVLEEKRVAGFDAVVLKSGSGEALVDWLSTNGYQHSSGLAEWSAPYIERGWPFTALKVADDTPRPDPHSKIHAAALRISFKTDVPLFPYREPESTKAAEKLGADKRLLRIYFIADRPYDGVFENGEKWSGKRAWSDDISDSKASLLKSLAIPAITTPKTWWLTEFEDFWLYKKAPGDLHFVPAEDSTLVLHRARVGISRLWLFFPLLLVGIYIFLRQRMLRREREDLLQLMAS